MGFKVDKIKNRFLIDSEMTIERTRKDDSQIKRKHFSNNWGILERCTVPVPYPFRTCSVPVPSLGYGTGTEQVRKMYATGDDYPSVVSKWFLSDVRVFPGVSKND